MPFVFLLGNHSSGKSSFVNYICQRKIQTAGVAPTDDRFTVIMPGSADKDRDGPALTSDPDMGFNGLRPFGPKLIHHSQLKVRSDLAIRDFMMVDTPGMIDSPMVRDSLGNVRHAVMDRGYDFESVCRWYAERADVILLFFDPDKPGTTGETLSVLTNSLLGLDHKLHIILNKADQFSKYHDFARAYGSLCWNLSKVIPRKDLPRIYTMCLPSSYQSHAIASQENDQSFGRRLKDLEDTREEVVREVMNAPHRRVDNEITRLSDSISLLEMHCLIVEELRSQYSRLKLKNGILLGTSLFTTIGLSSGSVFMSLPLELTAGFGASGVVLSSLLYWWQSKALDDHARELVSESRMEGVFKSIYARRLAEKDESINALWLRVKEHLKMGLLPTDLQKMPKISKADMASLTSMIEHDVPNLRRATSPPIYRP